MAARDENAAFSIIGYLLSGLLFWGGVGWGLDTWLGTSFLLVTGLLLGAGSGIYLVWLRLVSTSTATCCWCTRVKVRSA